MVEEIKFKSDEELYFSWYLEELQEAGYIESWGYEISKFQLTEPHSRKYLKQMKTKVKEEDEFLLHGSSITADFTIDWSKKALNVFVADSSIPVVKIKELPFRLGEEGWEDFLISYIEVKPIVEIQNSSVSFPYKQKFCLDRHGIYIQKIKPFDTKKKCLFSDTFFPKKVLECQKYKVNCKGGKIGESKIKHKIVRTLKEFVDEI